MFAEAAMNRSGAIFLLLLSTVTASTAQTGFTTQTYPTQSPQNANLRVADFNGDGSPDLLSFSGNINFPSSSTVGGAILFNDGSGGFGTPVTLPGTGALSLAQVGSLKGDGVQDIVGCVQGASSNLVTYLNDGTGKFTIGQTLPLPQGCASIVLGDINQDGHLDVVVATQITTFSSTAITVNNIFQTYFGDGTGKLGAPAIQQNVDLDDPSGSNGTTLCMVDDVIGGNFYLDGKFTLMVNSLCPSGQPYNPGTTFLAEGDGNGQYAFTLVRAGIGSLIDGHTVDVLKNGRPGGVFILSAGSHGTDSLGYLKNNGGGSFSDNTFGFGFPDSDSAVVGYTDVTVDEFNGDGLNDAAATVLASYPENMFFTPAVAVSTGSATGAFTQQQIWNLGADYTGNIVSADFNGDGKADLATLAYNGGNNTTTLYVYTQNASASSCAVPMNENTSVICQPAKGATIGSPVTVTAASHLPGFTLNRLYLDNVAIYESTTQSINTSITAAAGTHTLVLVSYTVNTGITTSTTFTVGTSSNGCIPAASGVDICAPTAGSTAASPVTITAGAVAQTGNITAIRAYIDNVAVFTADNPSTSKSYQVSRAVTANAGTHELVVIGYESTGAALTKSETFTVSANAPCYPSTAGARICSPAPNTTSSSPLNIVAGATAGSGYITAIRIYVDNAAQALLNNAQDSKSFAINHSVTLPKGTHDLVIVGYQSTGGSVTAYESITIQ
jgi:hypothetical protein